MTDHDVNHIVLTGRVHEEPEMRFTDDGEPYTSFSLASTSRKAKNAERVGLIQMVARGEKLAEACNDLLPGTRLLVEGSLHVLPDDDVLATFLYVVHIRRVIILDSPPDVAGAIAPLPNPRISPPSTTNAKAIPVQKRDGRLLSFPGVPRPGRTNGNLVQSKPEREPIASSDNVV